MRRSNRQRGGKARSWAQKLECPVDHDANYANTVWCNRDLIPIPRDRRTWTWQGFAGYWIIAAVNPTGWTVGSSLLSLGLSVKQAIGVMVGVALFSAIIAVVAGWPGSHLYLGFTVLSRSSWGMRGSFWPVMNRIMTAIVWLGIQIFWGGQAVRVILGAIIGKPFINMHNTIPASSNVDTVSIVSLFVYLAIFAPILLLPPEKMQLPFRISFVMITATILGVLIWSVKTAHGAGNLFSAPAKVHGAQLSWNAVFILQSIVGAQASACLGQSDWTRYAKTPNAALFGQLITAPIAICFTAICGIIIASATETIFGSYIWNPFELMLTIQKTHLTAAARAGTFFAGLGLLSSQLSLCIVQNCVSGGMDLAAFAPRYINIRRGSYILTVLAIVILPWNFVAKPTTFIAALSGWSVFLGPMTGIVVSDYFFVRKGRYHVGDLYLGNRESAYWYWQGVNWRGVAAWVMGIWPLLPGFVRNIQQKATGSGWDHIFAISYFYGFIVSMLCYWALHAFFPAARQTGSSPFVLDSDARSLGEEPTQSSREDVDELNVHGGEKEAIGGKGGRQTVEKL